MKILNLGKKSPVLVLLGEVTGKLLEEFNATFIGAKTSDTHPPAIATWVKFETAKDMDKFIEKNSLRWA
jgi:hypothetical protein